MQPVIWGKDTQNTTPDTPRQGTSNAQEVAFTAECPGMRLVAGQDRQQGYITRVWLMFGVRFAPSASRLLHRSAGVPALASEGQKGFDLCFGYVPCLGQKYGVYFGLFGRARSWYKNQSHV